MTDEEWEFETRAIHVGQEADPATGAIVTPIYQTSTFKQESVGVHKGYDYARSGNPTRTALQDCLASLEGARHGLSFSSGLAAEDTILRLVEPGGHLILANDVYGGTFRLISKVFVPAGIEYDVVDLTDMAQLEAAWRPETRMIWVETPTNPLLTVIDVERVSAFAHDNGALCIVDNTFATPYLQQPLHMGADIVVHSTTKYIGGHSDVIGGFLATDDDEAFERLAFLQNAVGAVPGPLDCYLTLRGLKTLAVRMERHCANAQAVVEMLSSHRKVTNVLYPGLAEHPTHEVARKQMRDFGGMVAFTVAGGAEAALKVVESTKVFSLAESLGAVESLIEHPGQMTHASTAGSPLELDQSLVRISVGIEHQTDLVADLRQALDSL